MFITQLFFSYWAITGIIYLCWLSYEDVKSKGKKIDDRKNWFMLALSFSLMSHVPHSLWYILFLLVVILAFGWLLNKFKVMAEGDVNAITWVAYGFAILNPYYAVAYFGVFVLLHCFVMGMLKLLGKTGVPYFPVLALGYILTLWLICSVVY